MQGESDWDKCRYFLARPSELVDYGVADHEPGTSAELLAAWSRRKHKTSCQYFSMVMTDLLNSAGMPCRQVAGWAIEPLPGRSYSYLSAEINVNHLMCEVWVDGRWVLLDPTDGGWYEGDRGRPLSAMEIQAALAEGRSPNWRGAGPDGRPRRGYAGLCAFLLCPCEPGMIHYGQAALKTFALGGWYWAMRSDPPVLVHSLQGGRAIALWRRIAAGLSLLSLLGLLLAVGLLIYGITRLWT